MVGDARYEVPGSNGTPHVVTMHHPGPRCDCLDFQHRGRTRPRQHVEAVRLYQEQLDPLTLEIERALELVPPGPPEGPGAETPGFRLLNDLEIEHEPDPTWALDGIMDEVAKLETEKRRRVTGPTSPINTAISKLG